MIDVHVGSLFLRDQFEWPLFSSNSVTPEDFSRIMCADLGIGGEFVAVVAHAIREQVVLARINFKESEKPKMWKERPLRKEEHEDDWEPELRLLTDDEIHVMLKEQDRNSRYIDSYTGKFILI